MPISPVTPVRRRRPWAGAPFVAPLVAGAASFVSSGPSAGILVSAAGPSGGTGSYAYHWQRNASGGGYSNLSNGGGVSGATSLNLTDASGSAGTLYGYRLVSTDASSNTATSNAVTAQVYTGGALTGGTPNIFAGGLVR